MSFIHSQPVFEMAGGSGMLKVFFGGGIKPLITDVLRTFVSEFTWHEYDIGLDVDGQVVESGHCGHGGPDFERSIHRSNGSI